MSKIGFLLMTIGVICMMAGAGGCDSGTCSLWISVFWVMGGMAIAYTGAKLIKYAN